MSSAATPTVDTKKKFDAFVLFGPPGVGKGTQGKLLGKVPGFLHIASGDIFRSLDRDSDLGKTFLEYSSKGELVPDELTVQMWREHMEGMIQNGSYRPDIQMLVLDGIPRNCEQAKMMDAHIVAHKVINLCAEDEDELLRRMRKRAEKEGRHDDAKVEVIRNRFEVYQRETAPMLEHYGSGRIANINAIASPGRVLADVLLAVVPIQEATIGNALAKA